ncbi:MAG TPA: hypothetical protein V6D19_02880 [Stenomitos sp.]
MTLPLPKLLELRQSYQSLLIEAQRQATEAKEQIAHINALLESGLSFPTLNLPAVEITTVESHVLPLPPATSEAEAQAQTEPLPQPKVKASTKVPKAIAAKPPQSEEIALLPVYAGLNRLEAIAKILGEHRGQSFHKDRITQLLYGEINPERLNEVGRRVRLSLYQGIRKGLWQNAPQQSSSYWIPAPEGKQKTRKTSTAETKEKSEIFEAPSVSTGSIAVPLPDPGIQVTPTQEPEESSNRRGRSPLVSLPAEFVGLSKLEAVSKILAEQPEQVMHIDALIERLYGSLSAEAQQQERVRMKDVMKRGIVQKRWHKAVGATSSIVLVKQTPPVAAPASTSPTGRKAKATSKTKASRSTKAKPKQSKKTS